MNNQQNFIVVYHFWFVDSNSFEQTYHPNTTIAEVEKEACLFKHKHENTFNKCAFKIIELEAPYHRPKLELVPTTSPESFLDRCLHKTTVIVIILLWWSCAVILLCMVFKFFINFNQ